MKIIKCLLFTMLCMFFGTTFAANYSISNDAIPVLSVQHTSAPVTFTVHNDSAQPAIMYVNWNAANLGWKLVSTTCSIMNGQSNAQESKFTLAQGAACNIMGTFTPTNPGVQTFSASLFIHEEKSLSITPKIITVKVANEPTPIPTPASDVIIKASLKTPFIGQVIQSMQTTAVYNFISNVNLSTIQVNLPSDIHGSVKLGCASGLVAYKTCPITITLDNPVVGTVQGFRPTIQVGFNDGSQYAVPAKNIAFTNDYSVTPIVTKAVLQTSFPSTALQGESISAQYSFTSNVNLKTIEVTLPSSIKGNVVVGCTSGVAAYKICPITVTVDTQTVGTFSGFQPSIQVNLNDETKYTVPTNEIDYTNSYTVNVEKSLLRVTLSQNFTQGKILINTDPPTAIYTLAASYDINNVQIQNLPNHVASTNDCQNVKTCTIRIIPDTSLINQFTATTPVITINGQPVANVEQFAGLDVTDKVDLWEYTQTSFPKFTGVGSAITATYRIENEDPALSGIKSAVITNLVSSEMTSDIAKNCTADVQSCEFHITYIPSQVTKLINFQPQIQINNQYTVVTQGFTPDSVKVLLLTKIEQLSGSGGFLQKMVVDPFTHNIYALIQLQSSPTVIHEKLWESQDHGTTWNEISMGNLAAVVDNQQSAYIKDFVVIKNTIYAIGAYNKAGDWKSNIITAPVQPVLQWTSFENDEFSLPYKFSLTNYVSADQSQRTLYVLGILGIYEKSLTDTQAKWKLIKPIVYQIYDGSLLLSENSKTLYSQYITKVMSDNKVLTYSPVIEDDTWNWQKDAAYPTAAGTCIVRDQLATQYDETLQTDTIYNLRNLCNSKMGLFVQNGPTGNFTTIVMPDGFVWSLAANNDLLAVAMGTLYISADQGNTWLKLPTNNNSRSITSVFMSTDGVIMASDGMYGIYFSSY